MPRDEALIPTAKLGRPPIPGTDGAGAGAGAGSGAVETGTVVDAVADSSPAGLVAANKFEVKITEKVSTNALNKVILLNTVFLTSECFQICNLWITGDCPRLWVALRKRSNDEGANEG